MKKNRDVFGCLWAVAGAFLLLFAIMWLDENSESLGWFKSSLAFGVIFLSVIVYRVQLSKRSGRRPRRRGSSDRSSAIHIPPKAEQIVEEDKIIFKRLPSYNPQRDRYIFFNEAHEMNQKGWQLIVDVITISLLDAEGGQLYQVKYDDITSLRNYYIWVDQMKFPVPTWATRLDETLNKTIIERAKLVKIKTIETSRERTIGGMIDREIEVSYYGRKN